MRSALRGVVAAGVVVLVAGCGGGGGGGKGGAPDASVTSADALVPPDGSGLQPDGSQSPRDGSSPTPDAFVPTPDAFVPTPDALVLNPDAFVPTPDAFVPTPDVFVPTPDAFVPTPDAFVPTPDAFVPDPDAFVPDLDAFVPAPDAFVPDPDAFVLNLDAFVPAPDAFVPDPDAFVLNLDAFVPAPDVFVPTPDAFAPPVDALADAGPWEQPLSPTSLPAIQLNINAEVGRAWTFANLIKGAQVWIKGRNGLATPDAAAAMAAEIAVDDTGWPVGLPADTEIQALVGYGSGEAVDPASGRLAGTYLHGVFVLTWQGAGEVVMMPSVNDGHGLQTLQSSPHRLVALLDTPFKYLVVRARNSDVADPIRNLKLWAPLSDGAGLDLTAQSDLAPGHIAGSLEPAPGAVDPLFHPRFLEHLRESPDAGVYRFLAWSRINGLADNEPPLTAAELPGPDQGMHELVVIDQGYTRHPVNAFHGRAGFAYELAIDLCNVMGRDCWLQVPHTATDELVRELAHRAAARLRPDLRLWIEFANEIWNSAPPYLPQRHLAAQVAAAHFGIDPAAASFSQIAWGAGQLQAHFFQTFQEVWQAAGLPDDRLINVVGGFAAGPSYNHDELASIAEVDPTLPEVLAISNYFGYGIQGDIYHLHAWNTPAGDWPPALYDATAAVVRRSLYSTVDTWTQDVAVARSFGLPTVSYEGGQHMLPTGYGDWNDPASVDFMTYMYAFQRSPQIAALYREHYALFSAVGGRTASQWFDIGTYSFWGYWGAKEYVTQTRAQAPKWDAFAAWGETQRGVRAPGDVLGTRPEYAAPKYNGEQGQPFSIDLDVSGGDGVVSIGLLGGSLPPGVQLVDLGAGHARLSGTPQAFGLFRFVIRALDADGDANDQRGTFGVDPAGTSTQALFAFRGADLPVSLQANGNPNGRYDPVRRVDNLNAGTALCVPFSLADGQPLFGPEYNGGLNRLAPTSALTFYGGFCVTALEGDTRVAPASMNMWTGLREGQFISWDGDLNGPTAFEALLLWRSPQFNALGGAGPYAFGVDDTTATLQIDMTALVGDGDNELHFVIQNHDAGGDTLYLSEAAYLDQFLGDGAFRLQRFSGNGDPGMRWAPIPEPVGDDLHLPAAAGLTFAAKDFDDVRAAGIFYRGARWRWNQSFAFNRVFALGERRP